MTIKDHRKLLVVCFVYNFHLFWDGTKTCWTVFVWEECNCCFAQSDTLGWPTLADRHLKTRLIMCYKITHIGIPTDIFVPSDNRLRKHHSQSYQHIQTSKDTIIQWNMLPQHTVQSTTLDIFREQLTPTVLYPLL